MNSPAQHGTDYSMGRCPICRDTCMIKRGMFGVDACPACVRLAEVEWLLARKDFVRELKGQRHNV